MGRVIEKTGGMTGTGLGWALASSAAAHFVLAGALLLSGAAGGFRIRGATVVTVDLVAEEPGIGGRFASATAPSEAPHRLRESPAPVGEEGIPSPRAEERQTAAAPALLGPAEAAREPAGMGAVFSAVGTIVPGPAAGIGPVVTGPAPPGMPHGPAAVPAGSGAGEGGTAGAAAGLVPRDDERDGEGGAAGGWGRSGLLRDRIQSRIVYPEEAVRRGLEGEVLLRIRIETGGNPGEVRVARSSGARLLDEAARRGVVRAAPLPASPGWVEVPVVFRLR